MAWPILKDLLSILPKISVTGNRQTLVLLNKVTLFGLQECVPRGYTRERPFWQTDRVDFYHKMPDGTIEHTPG